jgi:polyhydroxyalkanoate synthase subunit PhaC
MNKQVKPEPQLLDAVGATDPVAIPSAWQLLSSLGPVLGQGSAVGRESAALTAELIRIGIGRSAVRPRPGDGRFRDPAWQDNGIYRRVAQSYLATCRAADNLVDNLDGTDWRRVEKARFLMAILTSAAAPTNVLPGNPAALKRVFDTGGKSLVHGLAHWITDLRSNGGMPSTAKPGALKVGEDLAVSPGAVVSRDEVAELIRYTPTTEQVFERPTIVVPPPIGRFYFLDLAPGRSFVEYAVSRGLQTFLISWRNPRKEQAEWDMDTYAGRILTAIDEVRELTRTEDVNVIGFCAGGILTTAVLNHLAAIGDKRIRSVAFAVTLLDFGLSAPIGAFSSAKLLSLAHAKSRRAGIIDARSMGGVFSWMRPNDLVWNYWVNNYLLGKEPPVFDILSWSADGTNLSAKLHEQFLDIFANNPLVKPGERTFLGTPLDVSKIDIPKFVTGAINDHLTPWRGTYRTTEVMSGDSTFVLSNSGHIASLVNPPGNPKASYFIGEHDPALEPSAWLEKAEKRAGSWWEAWADWTVADAGLEKPSPKKLGSAKYPVLKDAPGLYVRDLLP